MWMEHDLLAELELTMVPLAGREPRRDLYMPCHEKAERSRTSRRTFWCAAKNQEVEVEFETKRVLGFPRVAAVKRCSAFDEPGQVACGRQCLDSRYRRQWPSDLPVLKVRRPPGS